MAIAAGQYHSVALCSDGTLAAWGYNGNGQLGNNSTTDSPVPVAVNLSGVLSGKTVVAVAAGHARSVALCSDGTVAAWGDGSYGQLGNDSTTDSPVPVAVSSTGILSGKTVVAIAAGQYHSVALCSDGTLAAWGWNGNGQLGDNSTTNSPVPVAVSSTGVLSGKTVVAVAAGSSHSVALCSDGTVAAWGDNGWGSLGNNSTTNSPVPVVVTGTGVLSGKNVVAVAAGSNHSVALCSDGTVAAWGYNGNGQLGNNSTTQSNVPVTVTRTGVLSGKTVVAVAAGQQSMALCSDGTVAAWGYNVFGQLGNNSTTNSSVPVLVTNTPLAAGERFTGIFRGQMSTHTLALVATPQLPDIAVAQASPLTDGIDSVALGTVAAGSSSTALTFTITNPGTADLSNLAITKDGADAGNFSVSALSGTTVPVGSGSVTFTVTFTPSGAAGVVVAKTAAIHIASNVAGAKNPFDIALNGTVRGSLSASYTTGSEVPLTASGFTASGSTVNFTLNYAPTPGTQLMVVKNTGLGFINGAFDNLVQGQTVGLSYGGVPYYFVANYYGGTGNDLVLVWKTTRAFAWGYNNLGQLGNNSTTLSTVPAAVSSTGVLSGKTVVAIAGGGSHSVALCSDGTVAAWGAGSYGQLGNDSSAQSHVPVEITRTGVLVGKTVVAVAASDESNVALCSDGTLAAWGWNRQGQLGNNSTTNSFVPVAVTNTGVLSGKTVVAIAMGAHSLALCSDGTVAAWGRNFYGQLGNNSTTNSSVPVAVAFTGALTGKTVVAVAAGGSHSVALCSDGTLTAWGYNAYGQLGNNSTTDSFVPVAVNLTGVLSGKTVVSVAAGQYHSIALCSDGTVAAWGYNASGQLGNNSTTNSTVPVAVNLTGVLSGKTVVAVAAGGSHSVALCSDGTLAAWGRNSNGQLGNGGTTQSNAPAAVTATPLAAGERFTGIGAGSINHTLALVAGPGGPDGPDIAVPQAGLLTDGLASVDIGTVPVGSSGAPVTFTITNPGTFDLSNLAITKDGADAGDFSVSALSGTSIPVGAGSVTFIVTFTPSGTGGVVVAKTAAIHIASNVAGAKNPFDIALNGTVRGSLSASYTTGSEVPLTASGFTASGSTVNFTLNYAPTPGTQLMVVKNTGLGFINGSFDNLAQGQTVGLSYGGVTYYFVANYYGGTGNDLVLVRKTTRAFAWGYNNLGQLGNNSTTQSTVPVAVTGTGVLSGKTVVAVAAGSSHSVALCSDGTLAAWGYNFYGQLGNNSTTQSNVPVAVNLTGVLTGKTVVAVAAGQYHSIALCSDGTVAAWGYNGNGQLGNNSTTQSNVPVAVNLTGVLSGKTVVAVAAGSSHSIALCSDGTVTTWGYNAYGQLGNNSTTDSSVPVAVNLTGVLSGKTVVAVATGQYHSVALCSDGTVATWGYNASGQLGNNNTTNSPVPAAVTGTGALSGKTVVAVAAGSSHSVALCSDGTLAAWGYNFYGQLGNNSTTQSNVPVAVNLTGVLSGKTVVAVAAGSSHSIALCSDGTVTTWGYNGNGQLGNNSTTNSSVPVLVTNTPLAAGERFTGVFGGPLNLHTLALVAGSLTPTVNTLGATLITDSGATLNGTVNANSISTTVSFDYGASTAYGNNVAGSPTPVTGGSTTAVSATLTGLSPGITYHFRVNGNGSNGATSGTDLTFTTLTSVQNWRQTWFGTTSNSGDAADGADPFHTGVPNLAVFAVLGPNQNPARVAAGLLPQPKFIGGNYVISFTQPTGVSGVTYGAEWCTDLSSGVWTPIADTGSGTTHTFGVLVGTKMQMFLRLRVSSP